MDIRELFQKSTPEAILKFSYYRLAILGLALISAAVGLAQEPLLTRHVREVNPVALDGVSARLPRLQVLHLVLTLPLRNQAQLDDFLQDVYDPTSPSYRHYLTVDEFTERFGPSQEDYDSVVVFANKNGLKVSGTSRNRMVVNVEGTVETIEKTLHTSMRVYKHPTEDRSYYAPDREPTLDSPVKLWHISGLDNFSIPKPLLSKRPSEEPSVGSAASTGSGPSSSFLGSDMRAAYYGGTALTGSGQSLGLFEFLGTDLADLNTYFTTIGQTNNVPITLVSVDGTGTSCLKASGCDDTEQTLDMTQAISMAPGLSNLAVYIGSSDAAILNAMATATPLNAQLSISWSWSPADPTTDDPYFREFAAQGQSVFVAAGDAAAWSSSTAYVFPSDDPYITSVGGTDLLTVSAGGAWSSETAWVNGGGGITPYQYPLPSYQAGVTGCTYCSTSYRNGPDVSANANWTFYVCANQTTCTANTYGGTSFAAPMWAAYTALANQQAAAGHNPTMGFLNPVLYTLGESANYSSDFHDVTSGSNGFPSVSGFDLATGWGSPNGNALIQALKGPNFSILASPNSFQLAPGASGVSTITATVSSSFNSAIGLSVSGLPAGVTASFSSSSFAAPGSGTSTLTLTIAPTTIGGAYSITVTGTGGGGTHSATISLIVTAPTFTLSILSAFATIPEGSTLSSALTTASYFGFNSAIGLSISGQPSGVTAVFSPASIDAPGKGNSSMNLTVGPTVPPGTYPLTITGTGGGISQSVNLTLTVPVPLFTISASPVSVRVADGSTGFVTITTASGNGFNAPISLSASGQPTGVTVGFIPNPIAAPGGGFSSVSLAVASTVAPGTYPITITGTGGGLTHSTSISLTVPVPNISLASSPASVTVGEGATGGSTITITPINGFNSTVGLSASGQPSGVTVGFSPATVAVVGSATSALSITVASTVAPGTYPILVTATSVGLTQSISVSLIVPVPNFSVSTSPASVSGGQGSSTAITISTASLYNFNSSIALSGSGMPSGVTVVFSPATIDAPGNGTSTMTLMIASNAALGTYPITVTGTGGGTAHSTTITLLDVVPSFTITPSPNPVTVALGSSGSQTITTASVNGFNSAIALAAFGMPSGVTASFSPASITAPGNGTSILTMTVASAVPTGTYSIAISGNGGGVSEVAYISLIVQATSNSITANFVGTQSTIGSGFTFTQAEGVALDSSGNLYVADATGATIKEVLAVNGVIPASPVIRTLYNSLFNMSFLTVDKNGNVFFTDNDTNNGVTNMVVKELVAVNGTIPSSPTVLRLGGGFEYPYGIAVDANGNVFVAEYFTSDVKEILAVNGSVPTNPTIVTLGSGFLYPAGIATDPNGDLFVADSGNHAVKELLAVNGSIPTSPTIVTVGSGFSGPQGITLDSNGDVFVADPDNSTVKEILAQNGVIPASPTINQIAHVSDAQGVAVGPNGAVYVATAGSLISEFFVQGTNFGSSSVGQASTSPLPLTFKIDSAGTLGSTSVLTEGSTGRDFTDNGNGTCTPNKVYNVAQTCTMVVNFTPRTSGIRYGSAALLNTSGAVLATAYLQGTGVAPQVNFMPGTQSTLGSTFSQASGVAVDASGNVFVTNSGAAPVKELLAVNGRIPASPSTQILGSGLTEPTGIALDGSGNVYLADFGGNAVIEILKAGNYATTITLGGGFNGPYGVAVDGSGNVFVADSNNSAIKKTPVGCVTSSCVITLGSGFNNPYGVAVDASGNVFVADTNNGAVKEILAAGGYVTVNTLLSGIDPRGVAVDGQGNLFVSDTDSNRVIEIFATGGYTAVNTVAQGLNLPYGLTVDGAGNLYVANSGTNLMSFVDFADAPSFTFAVTPDGSISSDSPQTVTVENVGNAPLTFPVPANGLNPIVTANFTLNSSDPSTCPPVASGSSSPGTLAAGASCLLPINFSPSQIGTVSGSLTLTDNNLNAQAPNYATQSISLSGTATQAIPTISWPTPAAITYGTALSGVLLNANTSVPGSFSYSPAAGTVLGAGQQTLTVTFTPTDSTDYTPETATVTLTVIAAPLTVKVNSSSKAYGAVLPVFTGAITGLKNGDTVTAAYGTSATASSPIGSYPITATLSGAALSNYTQTITPGTLTISTAMLTVATAPTTAVYGSGLPAFTYTVSGFVNGDTAASATTGTPSVTTNATATSPSGLYTITPSLGTLAAANYSFTFKTATLTITRAVLTVAADPMTVVYGTGLPAFTFTLSGFVNSDTAASVTTGTPNLTTGATAKSLAGTYTITPSQGSLAAVNYSFVFKTAPLTISKAVLTVTANNIGRIYGSSAPAFTAIVTGFVNGDASTVVTGNAALTSAVTAKSPVGTYVITAAAGTLKAGSYTFNFVPGTLTIAPATLTVTAANHALTYGAPTPALAYTISGFVNGENATSATTGTASITTTATPASNVGTYPITTAAGTLTATNYGLSFVAGTMTVSKALLTVSAINTSTKYGAAIPTLPYAITGFVNGDTVATATFGAPIITTTATAASPSGTFPISPATGTLTAPNYSFKFNAGTLTVLKTQLTLTADNLGKLYGAPMPNLTYSVAGLVNGDTAATAFTGTPSLVTTANAASSVGSFAITMTAGTTASTNYYFKYVGGTLTVSRAALTVIPNNATRTYGAAFPAISWSVSGLVNGDPSTVVTGAPSFTTTSTSKSAVGSYPITAIIGTLKATNYSFQFSSSTLTVTQAMLTVLAANKASVYGAAIPAFTYIVTGYLNGDTATTAIAGSPVITSAAVQGSNAGTYAITPAIGTLTATNYGFQFTSGTLTISKVPLTITAAHAIAPYNQAIPTLTFTSTGFVNGDTSAVLTGMPIETTTAVQGSDLGSYPITITTGTLAAANYTLKFVSGTLQVSSLGVVPNPVLKPLAGTYKAAQTVTITDTFPGATIHYTTDGTIPTVTSPTYTGSITVSSTETLTAIAVETGYTQSAKIPATYTITPQ